MLEAVPKFTAAGLLMRMLASVGSGRHAVGRVGLRERRQTMNLVRRWVIWLHQRLVGHNGVDATIK
jgi:hypothetical protein